MDKKRVRTPVLLQMEAAECGAASLGIILGYYHKFLPLEQLRQICGVSRNGSNAQNIAFAAEYFGMKVAGYSYAPEEVRKVIPPAILHWGFNHFLVYEGYDEKTQEVYLNDPAQGHRQVQWQEFEEMFTGILLVLRPAEGFVASGKPRSVWTMLLQPLWQDRKAMAFILGIGLCLAIVNLCVPVISQIFFDDVLNYLHREWLFNILLGLGIAVVLRSILYFLRSWCLLRWQGSMTIEESARFLEHILTLPLEFFQNRYAGEIASRIQFHEAIASFVTGTLATTLLDVAIAVFYLSLLFLYNVKLTIVGLAFTCINVFVTWYTYRWLSEQQMKLQQEAGTMCGISAMGIASIETLKANGDEGNFFAKWADANASYLLLSQKMEYYNQYISLVPAVLAGVNTAMIMAVGGFAIMDGFMTVGIFIAFQNLMGNFQEPVGKIVGMTQQVQQSQSQMVKIQDVYRYPAEEKKSLEVVDCKKFPAKLSGRLELKKVSYGYMRSAGPLIKRLNLTIEPGRRVAVVGRSGSGKSTLAKLVVGLYQPWSGEILFDGVPRSEIPDEVLAHSVSIVEQNIFLFDGTVAENIALFDPNIPRKDIIRAARDAMIHDDISLLHGGYDALVEEGGYNFSGGQRQRLEIAQALATNPSLLIFDEATSALDPATEQQIMVNIRRRGCSCLIVAHRLSTIRDCDEIIFLHRGRVAQRGTHEELASMEGHYQKFIQE